MEQVQRLRVRLQVSIVGLILSLVAVVALAALVIVMAVSSRTAQETAEARFAESAARVGEQIGGRIGDALSLAELGAHLPTGRAPIIGDGMAHPVLPFLLQSLGGTTLYSTYFGHANGDFLQVIAARGMPGILAAHQAPAATWTIVRAVSGQAGTRQQVWSFLDREGTLLDRRVEPQPSYDPRVRPWFSLARQGAGPVVGAPYVFASLQQPGFTASATMEGGGGVFGVDITLDGANAFLASQTVSAHGGVALLTGEGRVLAAGGSLLRDDVAPMQSLEGSRAGLTEQAVRQALAEGAQPGSRLLEVDGEPVLVHLATLQASTPLTVAVAAPFADFTGHIDKMRWQIIALAALVLMVVLPFSTAMAARLSNTVRQLASDAERIRRFDFGGE